MINISFTNRWKSKRLATMFAENSQKNSNLDVVDAYQFFYGSIVQKQKWDLTNELKETYRKYTLIQPYDIMINGLNLNYDFVSQRIALVKKTGVITSAYICLRPISDINAGYYSYLFKSMDARKMFHGMGTGIRLTLSFANLRNILLANPPRDEQDQIVRYLDWKVSEINKLIVAKKKDIIQIGELKKTIVSEAVTHGLHKGVQMRFSGVDWLGDIPAHWTTVKLRQILRPFSEKNHPDLPLLSVVREQGVIVRDVDDKEANHNFIPDDLCGYKMVKKGQFAMNKMKAWQGSYGVSDYTGIVSPAYFVFDIDFGNLQYFHYAIRSKVYVNFFAQASDGIRVGQWDLSVPKMKEIPFIVPPPDEQQEIVDYIPNAFARYEKAIKYLTKEIEKLQELKNRIISDVVTGQIDVRGVDIPDFDYIEDISDDEPFEETESSEE